MRFFCCGLSLYVHVVKNSLRQFAAKELSSQLSVCAVYFMPSELFVFLFHLVSGTGSGIRLYRFLIIAVASAFRQVINLTTPYGMLGSRRKQPLALLGVILYPT